MSRNVAGDHAVFGDLRNAIQVGIEDKALQSQLLSLVEKMQSNANSNTGFAAAYQDFISAGAQHMTILGPFLPALSKLLT